MDAYIRAINHALDMASNRLRWFSITGEQRHMTECKEWQEIAGIYMNQLISEQKHETCNNQYGTGY